MPALFDQAALAPFVRQALLSEMAPVAGAGEGPTGAGWAPYAAVIGGNAADALTTMQAIRSGRGREGNPLLPQSPAAIAGMKAALTVPEVWAMRALTKAGHPRIAKAIGYGIGALGGAMAVRNHRGGR